ncbi:MAG: cell division protein FtsW [Parcubacteria group bacterium]|nr:cell division protein FtsW [Parcubacteria group bacterium]
MYKKADSILLGIVGFLLLGGIFTLASASLGLLLESGGSVARIVGKQIAYGFGIGGALFAVTSSVRYRYWQKIALPFFLFTLGISFLVFVPHIGFSAGGASRWIVLGPIFFQPSELLKFGLVVYLASWMAVRQKAITTFRSGLLPFVVLLAAVGAVFVLQPDIGTLSVVIITAIALFFIGGGRLRQLALLVLLGFIFFGLLSVLEPYRISRIVTFFNPSADVQGAGYHIRQALIALGSGGLWGRGFGMGRQKFDYLPEPTGDSIFAVLGEEFGFVGSAILIIGFLAFAVRGLAVSRQAPDNFGRLLGSGLVILIITQSFMNIAAMTSLVPLTGLPLIFISQGGSALAVALAQVGILVSISKQRARM